MATRIRVGLLAADEDVRQGRAQLIDSFRDFQVVFEDGDGQSALNRLSDATIDLLVVNHRLKTIDGVSVVSQLVETSTNRPKIIMTGPFMSDELTVDAAKAGALATITMDAGAKDFIATMRRVRDFDDQKELAALVAAANRFRSGGGQLTLGNRDFAALTEKQRLIIELYAKGLTDSQSNVKLRIKPETQAKYLQSIFDTLNLKTRSQLVLAAYQMELI
jgi:DNA-binding NarL/FixJ family response regulator